MRVGDQVVEDLPAVLNDDDPLRCLEEDILRRIPGLKFILNLPLQVVGAVLCLPYAVKEVEFVDKGAIGTQVFSVALQGVLLYQVPLALPGAVLKEFCQTAELARPR